VRGSGLAANFDWRGWVGRDRLSRGGLGSRPSLAAKTTLVGGGKKNSGAVKLRPGGGGGVDGGSLYLLLPGFLFNHGLTADGKAGKFKKRRVISRKAQGG